MFLTSVHVVVEALREGTPKKGDTSVFLLTRSTYCCTMGLRMRYDDLSSPCYHLMSAWIPGLSKFPKTTLQSRRSDDEDAFIYFLQLRLAPTTTTTIMSVLDDYEDAILIFLEIRKYGHLCLDSGVVSHVSM